MNNPSIFTSVFAASAALVCCGSIANAQNYPTKPLRIVTAAAGANLDFTARLIGQGIAERLGQPVIVENRSSGIIPMITVAKAQPDGYTLLLYGSTFWVGPLLKKLPYDPVRDFAPVSMTNQQPNALVVHPSVPVSSVKELVALAKQRPGEINYASGATGSITHLSSEFFAGMAGVKITRVPYTSATVQITDLMAGRTQMMFGNGSHVIQAIKIGKLKALAVSTREPTALYPGLPTVSSSGVPGYESVGRTGIFAPAGTPNSIIRRLNQEIVRVIHTPDVKEKFFAHGGDTVGSSPEELLATIKSEMARVAEVIKRTGVRVD